MSLSSTLGEVWAPAAAHPMLASSADQQTYLAAKAYFDTLKLPLVITGSPAQSVMYVNFDGTGNNKYTNPQEKSNVAQLNDALEAVGITPTYEIGVGTTGNYQVVQQALGIDAVQRVKDAITTVAADFATLKAAHPEAQPYLIVTGFSRGAAEARLFMQFIDSFGIPGSNTVIQDLTSDISQAQAPGGSVHMSALLYDTVATSMPGNFAIPGTVDSVVQLTARNEQRAFFPLTSIEAGPNQASNRLIEIQLPGVHSDIGGG